MESQLAPSAVAEYMVCEDTAKNDCAVPTKGLIHFVEAEVNFLFNLKHWSKFLVNRKTLEHSKNDNSLRTLKQNMSLGGAQHLKGGLCIDK